MKLKNWTTPKYEVNEANSHVLTCTTRQVFILLSNLPPGNVHPSQRWMADKFGVSVRTIKRAIRRLVKEGYIQVRRAFLSAKGRWLNCYEVVKKLVRKLDVSPRMSPTYIEDETKRKEKKKLSPVDNNFEVSEEAKKLCEQNKINLEEEKQKFVKYNQERGRKYWNVTDAFTGWIRNKLEMMGKKKPKIELEAKQVVKSIEETQKFIKVINDHKKGSPKMAQTCINQMYRSLGEPPKYPESQMEERNHGT